MEKLTANSPEAQSADLIAANIARLKALFPELVSEDKNGAAINVDVLKALVGDATVSDTDEKYGLNWHGKRAARQLALTPSTGTLRPCPEESVDWDSTQNLMIEGDNLEVLKLLQKSYAGKVKLIYIDPPYNTGKDFVYPDNYQDNIKNYLELTGQIEGGQKISSNTESNGRFHTDWLNMMYPRLKLAKNLLSNKGIIFISIDSSEVANLRATMDEVFGSENFIGLLPTVMNLKGNNDAFAFTDTHEFTIVYAKNKDKCTVFKLPISEESFDEWLEDEYGLYKRADTLRRTGQDASREHRPNGWFPVFINEYNEVYTTIDNKPISATDLELWPTSKTGEELSWTWSKNKINKEPFNLIVVNGKEGKNIYKKQRPSIGDLPTSKPKSILYKPEYSSSNGTAEISSLLGKNLFRNPPKPCSLIRDLLIVGSSSGDIILDFFAGTGTTGQVVMEQNSTDGGSRRYILVQLPEPLDPENKDQKAAAEFCDKLDKPRTIAEITKERLRRAGDKLKAENPDWQGDTGFRVFKLDTSNIRAWNPQPENLQDALLDYQNNLLAGRSEADVLYELLLKLGLDLCVPIETRDIANFTVYAVGGGVLLACLAEEISREQAEPLALGIAAWHKELAPAGDSTCVFRDNAFADDVAKTNLSTILEQHGIANVRSL